METGLKAAIRFPFRGEKRWTNLGFAAVCMLIPLVGPLVLLGYGTLVEKSLIENLDGDPPTFDFSNFTFYLRRGLYPFLANLIFIPILMFAIIPVVGMFIFAAIALQRHPLAAIALILLAVLFELVLIGLSTVALTPITLKSGLEETVGGAFHWPFIKDFMKRVGWLTIGMNLGMMAVSLVLVPVIWCFPLVYAGAAALTLMRCHVRAQLYLAHLGRGGLPINIKEDMGMAPAFPVVAPPLQRYPEQ